MRLADSRHAATRASLRFATDTIPGITRQRRGSAFRYLAHGGRAVSAADLRRIEALAIPPAWTRVWISPHRNGHLQATGLDAKGRKQYRYHADWTRHRNLSKFDGLLDFAKVLPAVRRRVARDLRARGLAKAKVCACVVHLLDETHIRIGNAEYAKTNESYGLTTILDDHARIVGGEIRFRFRAKSGKMCETVHHSPRVARIAKHCQDLPGHELFAYLDPDGTPRDIQSGDVNDYLFAASGLPITAKDFRTWWGTTIAAETLARLGFPAPGTLSKAERKRREARAVKAASLVLYNTVSTCRKFYVHPGLIDAYADGTLARCFAAAQRTAQPRELEVAERAVLAFLRRAAR